MPPRKKAPAAKASAAPTSSASARPSRTKQQPSAPAPPSSSSSQDDSEEEDIKPVIRATRGTRASAGGSTPVPTRTTRARESVASISTPAEARPTASRGAKGRVDALKSAGGAGRRTRASESSVVSVMEDEEEEEDEAEEESEEGSEEEEVVQKPARRGAKKVVVATEDEEEEDVKPVIPKKGRGKTAVAASPEPEDEADEEEAAVEKEDEEEEEYEEEETIAPKKKDNKKVKPSARVISSPAPSHDEDDTAQIASDAEDPAATPVPTTPSKSASIEQNQLPSPSASPPPPVVAPPPPVFVNTAHDLAAAAKAAAERHYESVKEREKEREGKPRLVIHQMVMEDFKSYRGRGVIGPFHKSFSAIVGPNGSGKSNTIDALLFVFGYRATKMRQGKLSELIHNSGSPADTVVEEPVAAPADAEADEYAEEEDEDEDDYDQGGKKKKGKKGKGKKKATVQDEAGLIGSCTVEVWFREIIDLPGGDEFTVVPNSQLVVSRTAYRNNSSRYTINGRASTFTEVTTLLKGRGIDLEHKRFLILQGEVESIAQMKPKGATEHDEGLLEYLEDIIGTSRYKTEIEVAVVEVERLNDARGVQMNRVKLVEREKSALEGRKKEADAFLKDQNELVHNQSALFQVNIHQASINSVVYEEAVTIATTELTEEVEAQAGSRQEVNALQEEFDQLVKDTKDAEKTTNELSKELAVFDKTDVQLQEKKKSTLTKTKKLKKSLADDSHTKSEAETWVRNHTEELQKVRGECDKMESVLEAEEAELDQVRDSLKGKTEVYSTQIESLQTDLQPWAAQIADQQASIDLATNERDLLAEKTNSIKVGIDEAKSTLENLAADDAAKHERLETLEAEKQQVESEVEAARSTLNDMQAEDAKLRTKATVARQKSDEAKASHSASRSQGNVLSSLTKLKEQGRLAGFHGRLGNLGRIDDKYDVAISTACGGLDNLVTDTISVGQACIEHLRKNDLGRANVMCLDRIVARDMSTVQTPENAPRLFDLITVKESKFAPAFFQLLTNTLVANDLDQGKRLAFGGGKRWRVVTLDGQLIDVSGTMSGGGGRPMKGKMSSKIVADEVSPELVAKCEREQSVTVEALRVFVESREKVEATLRSLRKRLPEIELTISKVGMDIKTGGKRREEAERRLADLQSQSKPEAGDVKKISQLDKDVATLSKGLVQLQKESSSIETKIKALQEKILEVGGVKLRSQQTKVQDLRSRISLANDRLTKSEVGRAKSEKDAIKLGKAIEANNLALKLAEGELEHLTTQISDGAATSSTVRKAVEQSKVVLDEKVEELAEMKKDLDDKVDMITQFKKRELELKQHLGAQQKLLDESKHAVVYWSDKLGDLQLNDIDDDDEEDEEVEGKAPKAENVLHQWTEEEIPGLDVKLLKAKISALEERVARSNLDLSVLKEYARREKEFMQRAADLDAVTQERDAAKKTSDDLRNKRLKEFMEGFGIISMQLKSMYQLITLGGNAELELVDSLDPFSEGVTFSVMPPKKSWKNISNLSGGEKTLSSLALVFALQIFKPTPLYFMDEIDAALDFRNVSIIANYIKERTKGCQFVVVSLRNNMYVVAIAVQRRRHLLTLSVHRFELSSRLIGVYKVANQTRSVAIDNRDLAMVKA